MRFEILITPLGVLQKVKVKEIVGLLSPVLTNMRLDVSVACHSDCHQTQSKLSIGTPQSAIMKDLMKSFMKPRHWRSGEPNNGKHTMSKCRVGAKIMGS
jgi:hypothetical protein